MYEVGSSPPLKAVIRAVIVSSGYAITYPEEDQNIPPALDQQTITFSFKAWKSGDLPMKGQCVLLLRVRKFEKGWRALEAHPITAEKGGLA